MKNYEQPIIKLCCFLDEDVLLASESEKNSKDVIVDFDNIPDFL